LTLSETNGDQRPVLVTGAAGFFGRAIVRALSRDGVRVLATDWVDESEFSPRAGTADGLVDYARRDLQNQTLDDLVRASSGVVYAAALTPADEREGDTADRLLRVNLQAFLTLLGEVRRSEACRRLCFISSSGVYDQSVEKTLREEDADGGSSLYGAAKLAGEIVGRRFAHLFGVEFCAVRPTSLIGPGEVERPSRPRITAFMQLVRAALAGADVHLQAPESRADWLAVDDAAEAVALLMRVPTLGGRSFNVSSGRPRPLREVADAVERVGGLRRAGRGRPIGSGADRPATISNERLTALGWAPRCSLDDVVRQVMAELGGE
jgi:nucleoside-diphosphate-sugar epimerase